jgi:acyl-CoA synthetase (AMP-forming)/AMP-acid ligase II
VLAAGGAHVFMPRYAAGEAWRLAQRHRVTALIAVPAMVEDLAAHAAGLRGARAAQAQALPSVTKLLVGAGGMPPRLQVRAAAGPRPAPSSSSLLHAASAPSPRSSSWPAAPALAARHARCQTHNRPGSPAAACSGVMAATE